MAEDSLLDLVNNAIAALIEVKERLEEGEGISSEPKSGEEWKPVDFFDSLPGAVSKEEMDNAVKTASMPENNSVENADDENMKNLEVPETEPAPEQQVKSEPVSGAEPVADGKSISEAAEGAMLEKEPVADEKSISEAADEGTMLEKEPVADGEFKGEEALTTMEGAIPEPVAKSSEKLIPKFCRQCGTPVTPGAKFCRGCGIKLDFS